MIIKISLRFPNFHFDSCTLILNFSFLVTQWFKELWTLNFFSRKIKRKAALNQSDLFFFFSYEEVVVPSWSTWKCWGQRWHFCYRLHGKHDALLQIIRTEMPSYTSIIGYIYPHAFTFSIINELKHLTRNECLGIRIFLLILVPFG
jgi:hypothetical protein